MYLVSKLYIWMLHHPAGAKILRLRLDLVGF
jgi:hypothetical protein